MSEFQTEEGLIGMSLRDDSLKMTEVTFGDSRTVTNVAESATRVPFSFESIEDRSTISILRDDINTLYETSGFSSNQIALSIDSDFVLIKKIPIDATLQQDELREHINWEISQLMINDLDHFIIDYEVLDESQRMSHTKQIIVVSIRKSIVEYVRDIFADTDLRLNTIDVDVFSAQRMITDGSVFSPDQKIALIDIRNKNLQFSILHHGFYLVVEVPYPMDEGVEMNTDKDEHMARIISKELRRIILDNKLGKSIEDMNEVFLYGDGVEDGIVEQLSQAHNVNLHRFNPFEKLTLSDSLNSVEITNHPESFVISLGAAIKGF
ncbi:MAG: pilus assembly protein PilM [Deferribacteres bacterium]|nr:pilus assembly protein PilM [candidate division KSB1 bacterium]MCB9511899.1 pilus assembly protein PilM [Deferribacteres bacterium]